MRVGIVGRGSIGSRHAKNAIALGHEVISFDNARRAQWVEDTETLAQSLEDLVDYSSEAILICTPASTHAAVARELLAVGYAGPLFVEKPLALSVEECDIFTAWPHQTTMVGYSCRFHQMVIDAKREHAPLAAGGRLVIECDMATWPGRSYADALDECSHEIDLALWWGAGPRVTAAELAGSKWVIGLEGGWCITVDGAALDYWRRWDGFSSTTGFSFIFNSADDFLVAGRDHYRTELRHFLDCALRGVPTQTPFADGIRVLDVIAQARAMAGVHV